MSDPRCRRGLSATLSFCIALLFLGGLPGCGNGDGKEPGETKGPSGPTTAADSPSDELSKKIEAFTGDHSRLAWMYYTKRDTTDVFGNYNHHQLWGLDTRDGRGARVILEDKGNYGRPLISPDGKWIVFTDKNTERKPSGNKHFEPVIYRVDWNGENLEELGKGYAVDVWRDPDSQVVWVYTVELGPTKAASMVAKKLERFQLVDPEHRETIYDETPISTENIQLSRDGKRASALFPWPHAGTLDLEAGGGKAQRRWQNQHGCWPSMAPDNSYVAWVFDGSHKKVHMFGDGAWKQWEVVVNNGPGMGGYEMYHPRWSNHVRYFTITGPYKERSIGKGGNDAEIYIGRFNEDLNEVGDWLKITKNQNGDFFPDLWVKDGEKAKVDRARFHPEGKAAPAVAAGGQPGPWPADPEGALFIWENNAPKSARTVTTESGSYESSVRAKERARFGPNFEMNTEGGWFDMDQFSTAAVDRVIDEGAPNGFALEALVTPASENSRGVLLAHPVFQIREEEGRFVFVSEKPEAVTIDMGEANPGEAVHLAASVSDGHWRLFRDGEERSAAPDFGEVEFMATRTGTTFGGGWSGLIEGVAIYERPLTGEEAAANHDLLFERRAERTPIPRVVVEGRLVEVTGNRDVESLDTYTRALLGYTYAVEKVVEGELKADRIFVYHWTILDRVPLDGYPRKVGETFRLELEPWERHPQLKGERRWNDSIEDFPEFIDMAPLDEEGKE